MSQTMTVERVVKENEWEGKYGKNQAYSLDLKMPDGRVEMGVTSNRKLKEDGTHNEPQEGEVLVGTIEPDGRGGEKLRIDYDATKELNQGGRPQFSSSESSTASKPSSKGETDWAAIGAEKRRCHSQEMAVRMCVAMDLLREGADWAHHIRAFANWFDEDAIAAGQRASQGQLPPSGQTTESQTAAPEQS